MFEQKLLHWALKRYVNDAAIQVEYWNGRVENYGLMGHPPRAAIRIRTPAAGRAILLHGSLGFGEAYAHGDIEIQGAFEELSRANAQTLDQPTWLDASTRWLLRHTNRKSKQKRQIQHHYDIGNDFYRRWLDTSMTYSCAYFQHPDDTLEDAQNHKRGYILRKLALAPGMRLLDIGCGWGHLLFHAAREYHIQGYGITLSREQYDYCVEQAEKKGLADRLKFELINYQDLAGHVRRFDRIVSVGMYEHVGKGNHDRYFQAVRELLRPDGLSLLHCISTDREYETNAWIDRYIFPGGYLPSERSVVSRLPEFGFQFLDYENLRQHYALTLEEWLRRFEAIEDHVVTQYGRTFYRTWRLYLGMCGGAFRAGLLDLSQFLFSGRKYVAPLTREYMDFSHEPAVMPPPVSRRLKTFGRPLPQTPLARRFLNRA